MAIRMQQRRGTASQWTSANPILNAGEMGWESDTNKFKIGDGVNLWANLDYFIDANSTVNPSFGTSIIFEGATADSYETTLAVTDPTADRTITFPDATGTVALTSDISELSQDAIDSALTAGTGITKTYNDGANTLTLAVDTTTIQARVTDVSDTEIGYLNGVTSAIQTQMDTKAPSANASFTGTFSAPTGTITSDMITNGTIVDADINASAAIALSKLSTDPLARANHSGSQTASTISDFDTQVRTNRLDQMAVPTASVALNTQKITGLATPTDSTDAATKAYVDAVTEGLHIHPSVVAATTANINLSTDVENGDTLDGVTLSTGNRILVKNQSTQSENGIYVVAASGAPVRAADFDSPAEIDGGDFVFVVGGTVNDNTGYVQVNTVGTVGTDAIAFTQFSGAGTFLAGNGLTLTGNTFSINTTITTDLSTTQTLTNKTLTSPKINEDVAVTATATELNYVDGVTSAIQTQLNALAPKADPTFTGTTTINAIADATTTTAARGGGYMGIPQSAASGSGSYTVVAADAGEHIYTTTTRTVTIPANSALALPIGTALTFISGAGATTTIAITTDTMYLAGAGTTGSRTLAAHGMATAVKVASTTWYISGNGLT